MNRKHNPFVALLALILLVVVVACICTGCTAEVPVDEPNTRFVIETKESIANGEYLIVTTDTYTGEQYLIYDGYNAGGLTKLEG